MAHLTNSQWETIYEGTLRIMSADTVEAFAHESLGCIAALVPARQHMLFTFKSYVPGNIEFGEAYVYGSTVHFLDVFLSGSYTDEDWLFNRMSLKAVDCAYRDSDIIDEESLVKMRVYKDIYVRDGVHYGMRVNMMANNQFAGSYSIFRSKEAGNFTDQELEICNRLAPLFAQRYRQLLAKATPTTTEKKKGGGSHESRGDRPLRPDLAGIPSGRAHRPGIFRRRSCRDAQRERLDRTQAPLQRLCEAGGEQALATRRYVPAALICNGLA